MTGRPDGNPKTLQQRFWDHIDVRGENDCWEWQASRREGYGVGYNNGKVMAHRWSYEMHHGIIPDGMVVCHTCDNPPCVNPKHLWAGTKKDNTQDAANKGRRYIPAGSEHPCSKLSEAEALEIKYSTLPIKEIQKKFGIGRTVIFGIRSGRGWKHLK